MPVKVKRSVQNRVLRLLEKKRAESRTHIIGRRDFASIGKSLSLKPQQVLKVLAASGKKPGELGLQPYFSGFQSDRAYIVFRLFGKRPGGKRNSLRSAIQETNAYLAKRGIGKKVTRKGAERMEREYGLEATRRNRVKRLLADTTLQVKDIAKKTGFIPYSVTKIGKNIRPAKTRISRPLRLRLLRELWNGGNAEELARRHSLRPNTIKKAAAELKAKLDGVFFLAQRAQARAEEGLLQNSENIYHFNEWARDIGAPVGELHAYFKEWENGPKPGSVFAKGHDKLVSEQGHKAREFAHVYKEPRQKPLRGNRQ